MNDKYSIQEGLESLDRIRLMMGYDMSKTLTEQIPGVENTTAPLMGNSGQSQRDDEEKNEFLKKNKQYQTPYQESSNSNSILIPTQSKVSLWKSGEDRQKSFFGSWFGTGWQEYIPKEDFLKKILPDNTLRSFTTPDNVEFFTNLERTNENPPYVYKFYGYIDKNGNPYNQKKYVGEIPKLLQKGNWFEENWQLLAQIAATIAVGIATGGQSLVVQALAQLGVDLVFTVKQLAEGDSVGALMTFIIGLTPVIGRLSKFGTKVPLQFLSKYGNELSKIKDPKTLSIFYNSLKGEEKLLMTRLIEQTPAELKKMADEGFANAMKKAVKDKTINLEKIPQSQRLWWKQFVVEPSVGVGTGVLATKEISKNEEQKLFDNEEKRQERSKTYEKLPDTQKDSAYMRVSSKINYDENDF